MKHLPSQGQVNSVHFEANVSLAEEKLAFKKWMLGALVLLLAFLAFSVSRQWGHVFQQDGNVQRHCHVIQRPGGATGQAGYASYCHSHPYQGLHRHD